MRREYQCLIPLLCFVFAFYAAYKWTRNSPIDASQICKQPQKLIPNNTFASSHQFFEKAYTNKSATLLGGAVRIPSQSFDDMAPNPLDDPRFEPFADLNKYLEQQFPLAKAYGKLEYVNTYGMLYTFKGIASAHALKPVLLMGHLDVVPVNEETLNQWEHPPFSGSYDGEWIYGRGTSDTKNTVVGILEAIENLLEQGWKPSRTVVVAFGFDEEISGPRGAQLLSQRLLERYGEDSFEMIVDEGFGLAQLDGIRLATAMVTERGYLDVKLQMHSHGGHSSMPPQHDAIGLMANVISELEDNPFAPSINDWRSDPTASMFQCVARYSPDLSSHYKHAFLDLDISGNRKDLIDYVTSKGGAMQYTIRTSQAVDILHGGIKVNALPELVTAKINYRVAIDSNTQEVLRHLESVISQVAHQYEFNFISNGTYIHRGSVYMNLTLDATTALEPAPVSPWHGYQWNLLSGTSLHVFEDLVPERAPLVVSPAIMTGNTDTRWYWGLTSNIYRFTPVYAEDMLNYHTVNEKLRFRSHLATVAWFYEFLQNVST